MKRGVLLLVVVLLLVSLVLSQPAPPPAPGDPDGGSDQSENDSEETTEEQITTKPNDSGQQDQNTGSQETQQDQTDEQEEVQSEEPQNQEQQGESSGWLLWLSVGLAAILLLGLVYFLITKFRTPEFELTEEHKRYVMKCKQRGMSPSRIADVLSDQGYSEAAIDAMLQEY